MAYGPVLEERIRAELARHVGFTERKMFGGLSFLVNGNMCCGITGTDLVLRLSLGFSDSSSNAWTGKQPSADASPCR